MATQQARTAARAEALRSLRYTLDVIARLDPSREAFPTGPDSLEQVERYARRNELVYAALALALAAGLDAGVGYDPGDPHPVVVYLELPSGQVSWHLPAHRAAWDGHSTTAKYARIAAFLPDAVTEVTCHRQSAAGGMPTAVTNRNNTL